MARILVIDDSDVIRTLLDVFLSDAGHEVDLAVDGAAGIDRAISNKYDIIICDIHMPKKNGYEVYQEISRRVPDSCFIMTDSLPDELAQLTLDAGAHQCLTKPFDLEQLRATIFKLLRKQQKV